MKKNYLLTLIFLISAVYYAQGQVDINSNSDKKNELKVDTRIDNMGYWTKMAEQGLVPVAPGIPVKPAEYKTSKINAKSVLTENSTDVPVTNLTNVTESENSIFVDPDNADYILNSNNSTSWSGDTVISLYGANYFQSANAGITWGGIPWGTGSINGGDPTTAINLNGRQYVNFISSSSGQGVSYSDNGITWSTATVAPNPGSLADKNHMWIDNSLSSPYAGNLYIAWTPFGGLDDSEIVISRSTNDGVSWSSPLNISSAVVAGSHNQGINLQSGPNGEVYAVWAIYDGWPTDESAMGFAKSTNGGTSFGTATRIINNIRGIRTTETSKNHRVNSFPSMAADISGGPSNGNIYIVWANVGVPGTNTGTNISVYCSRSTNSGTSWSTPVRVNQNPFTEGKESYFPWITCDAETGTLSVVFYDDRNTSSASCEVYAANSFDSGITWEDFVISDVSFTPSPIPGLASSYMGDYLGITAKGGKVYPCWTDTRGGLFMTYVSPYVTNNLERPTNLTADLNDVAGQVDLSWIFNPVVGFLYFNVYRDGLLLGTTTSTSYTDYLPDYGLYEYEVSAQHSGGVSFPDDVSVQWGDAGIFVNPSSLYVTLPPDIQTTEPLTISNMGELALNYDVTTVINTKSSKAYCTASGGCSEYISRVIFNTIDNTTGCNIYGEYTGISTTVKAGDTYSLTIQNGSVYSEDDLGVWIDWNQDNDFDDAGENVVCDIDNSGQGIFSITIPSNATAGTTTMRIRIKWSGSDCGSPCGATAYGEVEDYSINIAGWLLVSPKGGTIAPGDSQLLDVTFDASDLDLGVYTADILMNSNDPDQPSVIVPATLNISIGNPQIVVSPSSLNFGDIQVGLSNTLQFSIENTGTGVLAGTIYTPAEFTVSNAKNNGDNILNYVVNEGIIEYYDVTFVPTAVQPYNGNVEIDNNTGGSAELIAISGNGLPGPAPDIALYPTNFHVVLPPDNMTDELLQISNIGDSSLTYSTTIYYDNKSTWFNPSLKIGYTTKNFDSSNKIELSPFKQVGNTAPDAVGDILMQLDIQTLTGDDQLLGCEFDGAYLWFSGAGGTSGLYGNQIYKLDVSGNLIATYSQGTSSDWGIRDMAYDGTNIYGGDESGFYQIDPATGTVATMFTGNLGLGCIRTLAFSHVTGHFYASNWNTQILEFDTNGTQYATYTAPGLTTMYGLAYDEFTGNLWIFDRTGTPTTSFYEYNLSTQALTGVSLQVPLLLGLTDQTNGGAFMATDLITGKVALCGVVQGTNDIFFAMDLGDLETFSWLSVINNSSGWIPGGGSEDVTIRFDAMGLDYGIYTGNVEGTSNDPYDPSIMVPCTLEVANRVNLMVFLEGPFNGTNMDANIVEQIPLSQPFNTEPWNYPGTESVVSIPNSNIVDWVLLDFRDVEYLTLANVSPSILRKAAFILNDGSIVDLDGSSNIRIDKSINHYLFIAIWQRNHLGIMSANPLSLLDWSYTYDFTTSAVQAYGSDSQKELAPGIWGMIAANGYVDDVIDDLDISDIWISEAGKAGYLNGDYNLDGQTNNPDKNDYWKSNKGSQSYISICGFPIIDIRDGKTYNTVKIDDQCWMAENLNIGNRIDNPSNQVNNEIIEKYCYNNIEDSCDVYGGLYQWNELMHYNTSEGIQGICPDGWHIPTDEELNTLVNNSGGAGMAGGLLKEAGTNHWNPPNPANNGTGFTALPGGNRFFMWFPSGGNFNDINTSNYLWSSTEFDSEDAFIRQMTYTSAEVQSHYRHKNYGYSLRCIKD